MTDMDKHIYTLHLTKKQAEILSYACDQFSRLICGQDWSYQDLFEAAWERRAIEATGERMSKDYDCGWREMRSETEDLCKRIKKRYWGLDSNAMYGIHYDDTADLLFDIHQVIRHQLWLDRPEDQKSHVTVDSDRPFQISAEPLATIERI